MDAISIFCEDIRDEVGGSVSLVGIMPDNVEVASADGFLPKLAIYTRINLSIEEPAQEMSCFLRTVDGKDVAHSYFSLEQVQDALEHSKSQQNAIAGFISRIQTAPFPAQPGRVFAIVTSQGREHVSGSLNIMVAGQEDS